MFFLNFLISDEDWVNDHQQSVIIMPATQTRPKKEEYPGNKKNQEENAKKYKQPISTYIYPREHTSAVERQRYQRSSSREHDSSPKSSINSHEEEVKPVLMNKKVPLENRFKDVFKIKDHVDERKKYSSDEDRMVVDEGRSKIPPKYINGEPKELFKKGFTKVSKPTARELEYRNNKTDKQKYKELTEQHRYRTASPVHRRSIEHENDFDAKAYRPASPNRTKSLKRYESRGKDIEIQRESYREQRDIQKESRYRNRSSEPTRYQEPSPQNPVEEYPARNPYKQSESMPYRESIEKMMKSPVMRYKSFEEPRYPCEPEFTFEKRWDAPKHHSQNGGSRHGRDISPPEMYKDELQRFNGRQQSDTRVKQHFEVMTPDSTMSKVSPRDRFQNAKEKFQAMERERIKKPEPIKPQRKSLGETFERGNRQYSSNSWSSDEEIVAPRKSYRDFPQPERYPALERDLPGRMLPAKSLGSLVKGYRHSYAEPRNFPRVTGRVGLAAVNPY